MTTVPRKRHPYSQWAPDARALDLVGDKWSLLIVRDLLAGPVRFVELQRMLPGISAEQLRSRLARMIDDGLLKKTRYREVPPRVDYELTEGGLALIPVIAALARWGGTFTPAGPLPGEKTDVRALFRMLPALALNSGLAVPNGVVLAVQDTGDYYIVRAADDERAPSPVVVRRFVGDCDDSPFLTYVSGAEGDWVDALAIGAFDRLRIVGLVDLAEDVLRTLAGQPVVEVRHPQAVKDYPREVVA